MKPGDETWNAKNSGNLLKLCFVKAVNIPKQSFHCLDSMWYFYNSYLPSYNSALFQMKFEGWLSWQLANEWYAIQDR